MWYLFINNERRLDYKLGEESLAYAARFWARYETEGKEVFTVAMRTDPALLSAGKRNTNSETINGVIQRLKTHYPNLLLLLVGDKPPDAENFLEQ
ncbi:MAG: hypothetical protein ACOCXP_00120 [Candidatus Dojkabacteria bacterium]